MCCASLQEEAREGRHAAGTATAPKHKHKHGISKAGSAKPGQEPVQPGTAEAAEAAPRPKGAGKKAGNGQPDRKAPASSTGRNLPAPAGDADRLKDKAA